MGVQPPADEHCCTGPKRSSQSVGHAELQQEIDELGLLRIQVGGSGEDNQLTGLNWTLAAQGDFPILGGEEGDVGDGLLDGRGLLLAEQRAEVQPCAVVLILILAMPVKMILKSKDSPWFWQLTPFGGANASASKDMLAGGLIANGGLNSVLAYDFGSFTLSMGNHFSLHEGIPLTYESYKFDPGVSQQILKNGLKLDVPIGQRWIFDVYAIHTKFMTSAALDQYFTLGGELGYRLGAKPTATKKGGGYLKLGLYADVGENFTSAHAQIGTGWKF